jgi:hypothetical protein
MWTLETDRVRSEDWDLPPSGQLVPRLGRRLSNLPV